MSRKPSSVITVSVDMKSRTFDASRTAGTLPHTHSTSVRRRPQLMRRGPAGEAFRPRLRGERNAAAGLSAGRRATPSRLPAPQGRGAIATQRRSKVLSRSARDHHAGPARRTGRDPTVSSTERCCRCLRANAMGRGPQLRRPALAGEGEPNAVPERSPGKWSARFSRANMIPRPSRPFEQIVAADR